MIINYVKKISLTAKNQNRAYDLHLIRVTEHNNPKVTILKTQPIIITVPTIIKQPPISFDGFLY